MHLYFFFYKETHAEVNMWMLLQLTTKPLNLAIIQAYAPTANHDYNDME